VRILIAGAYPEDLTLGSPKFLLRLAEGLAARGHEVETLFSSDLSASLRGHRILPITLPIAVARAALCGRFDVVHVASGDAALFGRLRLVARHRRPLLVNQVLGSEHLHWQDFRRSAREGEEYISLQHRAWYGFYRLRQVRASQSLSDLVLCLSAADRNLAVEKGWQRPERIKVVPPGVDPVFLDSKPSPLESQNVVFFGSWTSRKGKSDIAHAFPAIKAARPQARLWIVGTRTPESDILADFLPELRHAIDVIPVVPDPPDRIVEMLGGASVCVCPSRYEGFGMAFLEMMAVGLPVVATATGGMADVIEPGVNGLMVRPRDPDALAAAVIELLGDREMRRRIGSKGRVTAARYTWQRVAADTAAAYQEARG
jgi:glycosyltransferase involved in cell wall biosynthesis